MAGQSKATAAVTIGMSSRDPSFLSKGVTETVSPVSSVMAAPHPNVVVSAQESSSAIELGHGPVSYELSECDSE